ncbi:MAG: protoporphyrinogen oxidase [Kineosporiaceae bacterium]
MSGAGHTDAVVLGAGVAGLAAARDLALSGARVVVLDPAQRPGGPVRTGVVGGMTCDLGAESFLTRRPELLDLLVELGTAAEVVAPRATAATVVRRGYRHDLPARTVFGVPSDPSTLAGLLTPDEVARAVAETPRPMTGDCSVADFVGTRLGTAVVDHVVDPLLGGVYAGRAADLSAEATLPQLAAAVRDGRGLREAAADVLAAAAAGPGSVPFAGLRGGVGRIPGLLADAVRRSGGQVRLGVAATALSRVGGRWAVATSTGQPTGHDGAAARPGGLTADAVVVATPAPVAGRLLAGPVPEASVLADVATADVAVVVLAVDARDVPDIAAGRSSGLLVPAPEGAAAGLAVKAVTFASAKWAWIGDQDPDTVLLRASVGRAGDPGASLLPDTDLVARALADVTRLLRPGGRLRLRDATVQRWPASLPQYRVGHAGTVGAVRSSVHAVPGLALAGNVLDGVGLPACVATGRAVAARVLAHLGARSRPSQEDPS